MSKYEKDCIRIILALIIMTVGFLLIGCTSPEVNYTKDLRGYSQVLNTNDPFIIRGMLREFPSPEFGIDFNGDGAGSNDEYEMFLGLERCRLCPLEKTDGS